MDNIEDIEKLNEYIDNCNIKLSHYDMAYVLSKIYNNKYRYLGKKKWEYYDDDNTWKDDENKKHLIKDIKNNLSNMFVKRSSHWLEMSLNEKCVNHEILYKIKSNKLLTAANYLKDDKYISIVIKEATSFFDIHSND